MDFCPRRPRFFGVSRLGRANAPDASAFGAPIFRHQGGEIGCRRKLPRGADQTTRTIESAGLEVEREQPVAIVTTWHP